MNSWIQYNKSSLIAGGVGLILFLGVAGLGVNYYLEEGETYNKIKSAENDIRGMASRPLPPTKEVADEVKAKTEEYRNQIGQVAKSLETFRQNSALVHVDAQSFQNSLKADSQEWLNVCKEKGITVNNDAKWMGFESYQASAPLGTASTMLNFEKSGIVNFLDILTNSGVTKFNRIYREPLPVEKPAAATVQPAGRRGQPQQAADDEEAMWQYMPFEVTFSGDRKSVATILNKLSASDKYLYVITALRVKNEKDKPILFSKPKTEEAKPVSAGIGLALDDGAANEGAEEAPAEPDAPAAPAHEEILKQVLGDEKVNVHMAVNLVFFPQQATEETQEEPEGEPEAADE